MRSQEGKFQLNNKKSAGIHSQLKDFIWYLIGLSALLSINAQAHVKWFAPYDVAVAPKAVGSVFTPSFLIIGALSIAFIFVASYLDRRLTTVTAYINRSRIHFARNFAENYPLEVMRYTLLIFFVAIWSIGGIVLTPELNHESLWISGLHIVMIISLLSPRTCWVAGVGIFILWGYSAVNYGFFHLSDYMIFLGIALFVIFYSCPALRVGEHKRFNILYGAIAFTLLWASIEKFVYPHWSYPIIEEFPHISMGLSKEAFMDLAGFGEFVLAFMLVATVGIGFWSATTGLALIFTAAIWDFGKVDAIGHLAIIIALLMMMVYGPSKLNFRLANLHPKPFINACLVTLVFTVSLVVFFVIYYGIRHIWLLTSTS